MQTIELINNVKQCVLSLFVSWYPKILIQWPYSPRWDLATCSNKEWLQGRLIVVSGLRNRQHTAYEILCELLQDLQPVFQNQTRGFKCGMFTCNSRLTSPSSCDSSRFLFRFLSLFSFAFLSFSFWYRVLRLSLFLISENTISFPSLAAIFVDNASAKSFSFSISLLVPRVPKNYQHSCNSRSHAIGHVTEYFPTKSSSIIKTQRVAKNAVSVCYAVPVHVTLCLSVSHCVCPCYAVPVHVTLCLSVLRRLSVLLCVCPCYAVSVHVTLCLSMLRCVCPCYALPVHVTLSLSMLRWRCLSVLRCACPCYAPRGYSGFQVTGMIKRFFWVSNFRFRDFLGYENLACIFWGSLIWVGIFWGIKRSALAA